MINYKLTLLFVLLCFLPNTVLAYRCAIPMTATEGLKYATAVFSGEVVAKELREAELNATDKEAKAKVWLTATKIKVKKWWKGSSDETIILVQYQYDFNDDRSISTQTFGFEIGKEYLIYANNYQNALQTSGCSRTKSLEQATEDLKELGEGDAPTKPVDRTLSEVLTEFIDKWNN